MRIAVPELIAMIQTTWPRIRVALYKREDGLFQFIEEGLRAEENGAKNWIHYRKSEYYKDLGEAKKDMIEYYCYQAEDEYWVRPESVTILEPPDFKGPHHPILMLGDEPYNP